MVACIAKDDVFLAEQQAVGPGDITDITGGAAHGVHQARFGIHANVSLHADIPLVAFLAGVHLKVTLFIFVLVGCECGNQGGVYGCARLEQQSALGQEFIGKAVDLLDQFVFLQPVSKSRNGGLIGQAGKLFELGKLPVERNVKKVSSIAGSDNARHCC